MTMGGRSHPLLWCWSGSHLALKLFANEWHSTAWFRAYAQRPSLSSNETSLWSASSHAAHHDAFHSRVVTTLLISSLSKLTSLVQLQTLALDLVHWTPRVGLKFSLIPFQVIYNWLTFMHSHRGVWIDTSSFPYPQQLAVSLTQSVPLSYLHKLLCPFPIVFALPHNLFRVLQPLKVTILDLPPLQHCFISPKGYWSHSCHIVFILKNFDLGIILAECRMVHKCFVSVP